MFIPFISSNATLRKLYRRKGGGAGGKGGGRSGGGKSTGSSGKSSSTGKSSVSSSGRSRSASSYGGGGGKPAAIPAGQLFAGRIAGGGTRSQIFGTRTYGSGYPGVTGRGVAGRGFPFYFWPLAWGGIAGVGTAAYLHSDEYGLPNNSSRPGGGMAVAAFQSNSTNTIFRLVGDNTTVTDLIDNIKANCSSSLTSSTAATPSTFNESASDAPKPEQAVQYFRASGVALTLDGYNNTAALEPEGTADTAFPTNIDAKLMDCLNQTIGLAVPLIDGADVRWATPNMGLVGLASVLWCLSSLF